MRLGVRHRGESRQPSDEHEREAAEQQRDRQVVEAARETEGDLGDLAALVAADQTGDRELRRGAGVADAEHEAAVDDVRVGRDHTVGGGVGAIRQPGLQPDAQPMLFALRMGDVEVVHLVSPRVIDAHRTERSSDVLVELEDDLGRLKRNGRTGRGRGAHQLRMGERGGRRS